MNIKRLREENDGFLPHYAWPGGYAFGYITKEGNMLCPDCAELEENVDDPVVAWSTDDYFNDRPLEEIDDTTQDARCAHCNMRIGVGAENESASEEDKHPYLYAVYVLSLPRHKHWTLMPDSIGPDYDRIQRSFHRYSYQNAVEHGRKLVARYEQQFPRMKFQVVRVHRKDVTKLPEYATKTELDEQVWWILVPEEEAT